MPVVFVINNNHWAISVPTDQQTSCKILAQKAISAGIRGVQTDGNDLIGLRQTIGDAIENARNKQGPTLIEAMTYRLSDHTTADDATRYQPQDEVNAAELQEPIPRFRNYLEKNFDWSHTDEENLHATCKAEIEKEVEVYLNRKPQPISAMFDYHFAELPDYLLEQKAIAMEDAND